VYFGASPVVYKCGPTICRYVCVCVYLFNVRADHIIKSRVLKAPREAKDVGEGRPPVLKLETNIYIFYGL